MRKTLLSLFALLLSFTAVNAQLHTLDGNAGNFIVKQQVPGMQKMLLPGSGVNKIDMAADERIMGYYTSDEIGTNPLCLNQNGNYKAGVEFTPEQIGHFVGGQITKVRFALGVAVGASKVSVYSVTADGQLSAPLSEEAVATTKQGWNDVTLTTPVTIQSGLDYLICYDFTQKTNQYPLSTDQGVNPNGGVDGGCLIYGNLGQGTGWYNMGTNYGNFCIQAVVKGGSFPDYDLTVGSFRTNQFVKPGENTAFSYTIKNSGNKIPASYTINVSFDDQVIATIDNPVALTNTTQTVTGNVTIPANATVGRHTLIASVAKINGETPENDTNDDKTGMYVNVYNESVPRQMNLVEQFTSTKCAPCVYGKVVLEALTELRSDLAFVAHHNKIPQSGDPMVCDDALAVSNTLNMTGNPSAVFNRYYETDPELNADGTLTLGLGYNPQYAEMAAKMLSQVIDNSNIMPAFASVGIKTTYDEGTRKLSVEVYGSGVNDFKEIVGEDAVLSVYLTEDGIVAAQNGGDANTVHNNVMRKAVSDVWGNAINWNGNAYSNTYEITLDSKWDAKNMHVVAFIGRPVSSESYIDDIWVNNANTCKIGETSSGIGSAIIDKGNGTEVERYTIDGRKVSEPVKGINLVKMSDGRIMKVIVK